jgi:FMN-dependent NADH-azoreductase
MFILHIDSSANTQKSISRSVSKILVDELVAKYTEAEVKNMDLAKNPLPFVDDTWLEKGHSHMTDELVGDLMKADIIVIGAPVYNLSIPASLKAYIDQIVVAGKTFNYTPEGPKGLVTGDKKVYIVSASGTPYGTLTQYGLNFHEPYLRAILGFIGITNVEVLAYSGRSQEESVAMIDKAKEDIKSIVEKHDYKKTQETL